MTKDSTLVERAMRLATRAHAGQARKESNLPYITHPFMVSLLLAKHGFSDTVLAAALTHDVLEDTPVTAAELEAELGPEVLALVQAVSYDESLSWEDQRTKYVADVRAASEDVKAISIADKIHNAQSFILGYEAQGKDMWKNFNRGRDKKIWFEEEMVTMLKETWQHPLVDQYAILVEEMKNLEY